MKIGKGKISNINKKILASGLVLTFLTTPLVGCSNLNTTFEYSVNEQGQCEASGTISYNELKKCYFIGVKDHQEDDIEYHIAYDQTNRCSVFKDIFTCAWVYGSLNPNDRILLTHEKLEYYLLKIDNIKTSYTKEDVEEILEQVKKIYLEEDNKELVKEK